MPGIVENMALVLGRRAERPEQRLLTGVQGKHKIIAAIDQQHGDFDVWGKVHGVSFRQHCIGVTASRGKDGNFEATDPTLSWTQSSRRCKPSARTLPFCPFKFAAYEGPKETLA